VIARLQTPVACQEIQFWGNLNAKIAFVLGRTKPYLEPEDIEKDISFLGA
jgi:hypothetical protein